MFLSSLQCGLKVLIMICHVFTMHQDVIINGNTAFYSEKDFSTLWWTIPELFVGPKKSFSFDSGPCVFETHT